jgi:hypothetical protein
VYFTGIREVLFRNLYKLADFIGFIVIPQNIFQPESATFTSSLCSRSVKLLLPLDAFIEDYDSELYNSEGVVISFYEGGGGVEMCSALR